MLERLYDDWRGLLGLDIIGFDEYLNIRIPLLHNTNKKLVLSSLNGIYEYYELKEEEENEKVKRMSRVQKTKS